jgi:hypothetical protein
MKRLYKAIIDRLTIFITLLCIAAIGLVVPKAAVKMMAGAEKAIEEEISTDVDKKECF